MRVTRLRLAAAVLAAVLAVGACGDGEAPPTAALSPTASLEPTSTTAPTVAASTATEVVEGAATPTPTAVAPPAATLLLPPADGSSPTVPPAATPVLTAPPPSATPAPATSPTPTLPPPPPGLERDPDYETALRVAGISTRRWLTDFTLHTVPYSEIRSGGPGRDGIPPIDSPKFATFEEAGEWLRDDEPVIVFEHAGDARAYPLQILIWHEIVNDVVGGLPVAITFCPLCNSAIAFDRNFEGEILDFGTTGNLRNSDLIMWDRQTESWWQQFTGEGIVGVHSGKRLSLVPSAINSWADFRAAYPGGKVLSRNTGFERDYGINPYLGYDRADNPPFLYNGPTDGRLPPKERVVAVSIGAEDAAYPFTLLEVERAVNDVVGGESIAVFFKPGTRSALDGTIIAQSRDVGATGAFSALLDGERLTFSYDGENIVDDATGSVWNIQGHAVSGPLEGKALKKIVHGDHFWFAWGVFKPNTRIYGA